MVGIIPLTEYHRTMEPNMYDSVGYPIIVIEDMKVTEIDRPTGI